MKKGESSIWNSLGAINFWENNDISTPYSFSPETCWNSFFVLSIQNVTSFNLSKFGKLIYTVKAT